MGSKEKIKKIHRHFKRVDPKLYAVLKTMPPEILKGKKGADYYFYRLCKAIISQQLGTAAASTIHKRFLDIFGKNPTPADLSAVPDKKLRAVGMSGAKTSYVKNLAAKILSGEIKLGHLHKLEDEKIIEELTQVKGIGRWTAEMFLIFTLGREDVFSHGDLGLSNGFAIIYGKRGASSKKRVEAVTKKWRPYRSYGSLALWHALDSKK